MTNQQPRPDDAVLGGQSQAPFDAAVLGGIGGVKQKLASDNESLKKEGVLQALNYGEKGIEALFGILEGEKSLEIQWLAHQTLEKLGDPGIKAKLKNYFPCYEYESMTVNRRGEIIKRTPGRARYYREDLGNGVYLDMVYIAGGDFLMGEVEIEYAGSYNERPGHQVTVPNFWLGKYQVTQAQWQAIMGENPALALFQGANRPLESVSWDGCQEFCRRLSERTERQYRLPSEAEWEYACRAGTTTPFNCGETITTDLANYDGNYTYADEEEGQYREGTVEVGSFPPNPWGIYDMHGNVWEWCEDGWHDNYSDAPVDGSPWNDNHFQNDMRVLRGGSWLCFPDFCRSARRNRSLDIRYDSDGFRLVLK
jgi:formylglycine-generating enzyme required for sulfatase activity